MFKATGAFDKSLEKATSHLLLETEWDAILQICDCIRQGDVTAKYAVQQIRKKIFNQNPHVSIYALQTLESVVKNCGAPIHDEIASKQFMEDLKDLVKVGEEKIKEKVLELIQIWSHAFRNESKYRIIQDTFNLMKMEGYKFPQLKESDAMFSAEIAPKWEDADECHRCRAAFGVMNRKHHCRHCGQVFCSKCSSKQATIPKFGIEKEVRVCEACFEKINTVNMEGQEEGVGGAVTKTDSVTGLPKEYLNSPLSKESQQPPPRTESKDDDDLQLAIALSQSEAEEKEKQKKKLTSMYSEQHRAVAAPPTTTMSAPPMETLDELHPELAKYLNRSYWEQKEAEKEERKLAAAAAATSPNEPSVTSSSGVTAPAKVQEKYQNGETEDMDEFMGALKSSVEIFENRMKSNSARGRHVCFDSSVQSLFMSLTTMHPILMKYMNEQDEARAQLELQQEKVSQVKEAREALDALREEHQDKLRREAEERQRQRQMQMMMKLEDMRKKKHEYLEYQRQMALRRMQEQEMELQMRKQQQYQGYTVGQPGYGAPPQPMQGYPQGYMAPPVPGQPGYSPDVSPMHQQMLQQQHQVPQQQQQQQPGAGPGYGLTGGEYYTSVGASYQPGPAMAPYHPGQPAPPPAAQYGPGSSSYTTHSQPQDYSPYNMQNVSAALPVDPQPPSYDSVAPNQPPQQAQYEQQQAPPGYTPDTTGQQQPPQQQYQTQQQPAVTQEQQQNVPMPPQQQQQQQQPNPQLISFD